MRRLGRNLFLPWQHFALLSNAHFLRMASSQDRGFLLISARVRPVSQIPAEASHPIVGSVVERLALSFGNGPSRAFINVARAPRSLGIITSPSLHLCAMQYSEISRDYPFVRRYLVGVAFMNAAMASFPG